MRNIRLW